MRLYRMDVHQERSRPIQARQSAEGELVNLFGPGGVRGGDLAGILVVVIAFRTGAIVHLESLIEAPMGGDVGVRHHSRSGVSGGAKTLGESPCRFRQYVVAPLYSVDARVEPRQQ